MCGGEEGKVDLAMMGFAFMGQEGSIWIIPD